MSAYVEYEILCSGEPVAKVYGPEDSGLADAFHYARQYRADGPVRIYRVFANAERELVAAMSKFYGGAA
jgi:hypothetical protein